MSEYIKTKLIEAGVKNLKEFGYPKVTTENIMTDSIYSAFFGALLESNKGHGSDIDASIDDLLAQKPLN